MKQKINANRTLSKTTDIDKIATLEEKIDKIENNLRISVTRGGLQLKTKPGSTLTLTQKHSSNWSKN